MGATTTDSHHWTVTRCGHAQIPYRTDPTECCEDAPKAPPLRGRVNNVTLPWSLTHVPTGLRLHFDREAAAKDMASRPADAVALITRSAVAALRGEDATDAAKARARRALAVLGGGA